ncbi:MAG: hypothetical protein H6838_12785 [Planctomycetes bacterium]|nr:hypothetical protein [Planctomycetota bacterium]
MQTSVLLCSAAIVLSLPLTAQTLVVAPTGYDTVEGNSNNIYPWGRNAASMHYLQIQDSSNFTSQNVTGPVLINNLRFRVDNALSAATWTGGSWPNVVIEMSTAAVDYTAISATFAANHGPDRTIVHSGAVTVQAGSRPGSSTTPGVWHIDIPLTTPFLYDPSTGNDIVLDVQLDGTGWSGGATQCDAVSGATALGSRIWDSNSSNGPTASGTGVNYCILCEYTCVPTSGYAYSTPYGDGCVRQYASFQESYSACDLSNTSFAMQNIGTGYVVLPGSTPLYVPTSTPIVMGDDQVIQFPLNWTLPYPGGTTTDLYVSSNGFVHGAPNTNNGCCAFNGALFLGNGPCWAAKWRDLNPAAGGSVYFDTDPVTGTAYVTFDSVPDYGSTNPNTFQYAFDASGTVELRFGNMDPTAGTTGYSPGNNNLLPPSIDLSAISVLITEANDIAPITHSSSARPVIGTAFSLETNNVPAISVVGATLFGLTEINPGLDLTSLGMPGCHQYVSIDASQVWVPAGGVGSTSFSIPNAPAFAGVEIKTQGVALVPGINALGALSTNGIKHFIDIN